MTQPTTATLQQRLTDEMKAAMKAGQKERLGVIRMLLSEVKNVDLNPAKPTPEQAVEAYAKKLRKSVEEYEKIGRAQEVATLKTELSVVDEFLPKKADKAETERLVDAFLAANSFTEKDVGRATGVFMKQHGGAVDASLVNPLLKSKLAGK
jgi:uncharacterized protein YqeY